MKLLIDNALPPRLAELLRAAGLDAVHLREQIDPKANDEQVFALAASEHRIIVSADTDFGTILANRQTAEPSFILLRHDAPSLPQQQCDRILHVIRILSEELSSGCIVSIGNERVRVRRLPLR